MNDGGSGIPNERLLPGTVDSPGGEGLDFEKLKMRSGIIALISLLISMPYLYLLRESLPDDYGAITMETAQGAGFLLYVLLLTFLVTVTIWLVLVFTPVDGPDILDNSTRSKIIIISASFSFITGLSFYTDYYFLFMIFFPIASGFYVDRYYRKRFPHSLLRAYHNMSILFGFILGYIAATALVWSDFEDLVGDEFMGLDTYSQEFSVVRIGIFIVLYLCMSFIGLVMNEYRGSYARTFSLPERPDLIRKNLKTIIIISVLLGIALALILAIEYIAGFEGNFEWFFAGIFIVFAVLFVIPSVLRLLVLLEK